MIETNVKMGNNIIPVCVVFGNGDIRVNASQKRGDGYVDVYLSETEQGNIDTEVREDDTPKQSDDIRIAVMMQFNKPESIDALIFMLMRARQELLTPESPNYGSETER